MKLDLRRAEAADARAPQAHGETLVDERVDLPVEGDEPPVGAVPPGALGHKGARASPALDQASQLEIPIDLRDRHRRHADLVGELTHGGQALAWTKLATGDAVFEEAAQLRPEGHRQVAIKAQADGRKGHVFQ